MTCEVYDTRDVKATRKEHRCEYCGADIPIGSPALYEHGVFEGEAFGRYCCLECKPFMHEFWEFVDGMASSSIQSDFYEFVRFCRIPHPTLTVEIECPSCGTVRVMRDEWEDDGWADCPKCGATLERSGS